MTHYGILLKNLRESRRLTQEQAAEAAGISVDSWYRYEAGKGMPSDDNIPGICAALDAPWLAVCYLEARDPCGTLPPLFVRSLATAALSLAVRLNDFTDNGLRTLLKVAEDDQVSPDEEAAYQRIVRQLDQLIEAALAVKFPESIKKDRPEAGTSERLKGKNPSNIDVIITRKNAPVNPYPKKGGAK